MFQFHFYGLILGFSFLVGFAYFQKYTIIAKKYHDHIFFGLVLFGIIGARIYHVADKWSYYSQNLDQIIKIWNGGLGLYGGFLGCLVFLLVFCKKNNISLLHLLSQIAPSIPLVQAIARWGNFANKEIYSSTGQPIWLYESIACFLLFLFIKFTKSHALSKYLIGYGLIRFFLEFIRSDTWQIQDIKVAQIISLLLIFLGASLTKRIK